MKKILILLFTLMISSVGFGLGVGAKGGLLLYTGDSEDYSGYVMGADVQFGIGPLTIFPEILYTKATHEVSDNYDAFDVQFNINLKVKIPVIGIFAGAGAGMHYMWSEVDGNEVKEPETYSGFHFFAGYELSTPLISPYIEARYVIINNDDLDEQGQFMLMVGVNIGF